MYKHYYPAVFTKEDVGYSVSFPDLESCFTQGDTLEQAVEMASEAIGLCLENNGIFTYPQSTNPSEIKVNENEFIMMIAFDEIEYRKKTDSKSVKKTLTIPSWLNVAAENAHINFSGLLQTAIKNELHIEE